MTLEIARAAATKLTKQISDIDANVAEQQASREVLTVQLEAVKAQIAKLEATAAKPA